LTENSSGEQSSMARLRRAYITPELVSGTVLVSVVIAVADEANGIFDVFAVTVLSVLVFWLTEVFAHTVADQRRRTDEDTVNLRSSVGKAVHQSRGLLLAAIPPFIFLLLGLFGVNEGQLAYWVALWVGVGVLAVVGWIAFGGRGIHWYWRLGGAAATAALGMLAILLKLLVKGVGH
jgi:hypothetical protein